MSSLLQNNLHQTREGMTSLFIFHIQFYSILKFLVKWELHSRSWANENERKNWFFTDLIFNLMSAVLFHFHSGNLCCEWWLKKKEVNWKNIKSYYVLVVLCFTWFLHSHVLLPGCFNNSVPSAMAESPLTPPSGGQLIKRPRIGRACTQHFSYAAVTMVLADHYIFIWIV